MDILSFIVPSINVYIAAVAKLCKNLNFYISKISKTANIILLSYTLLKLLAVKHANPLLNVTQSKYCFHVLNCETQPRD